MLCPPLFQVLNLDREPSIGVRSSSRVLIAVDNGHTRDSEWDRYRCFKNKNQIPKDELNVVRRGR